MADKDPQGQKQFETGAPASSPDDYYSALTSLIGEASKDPALLRNLVYVLARHNLKSGATEARPTLEPAQLKELERAIEHLKADLPQQDQQPPDLLGHTAAGGRDVPSSFVTDRSPDDNPFARSALVPHSLEPVAWPERRARPYISQVPARLNPNTAVSVDFIEYAPVEREQTRRSKFAPVVQLGAAAVLGLILYVGVSFWVERGQKYASVFAPAVAPPRGATGAPGPAGTAAKNPPGEASAPPQQPSPESPFPFPLPRSYGVYAGSNGQLVALEQLPIKVPIARVQISAEITQPSKATVAKENLAFVVYRRDLVASAPQSVSVRVVARVKRAMNFVDGKPKLAPIEGSWRIRDKSYEFQVSPVESNREMVVIQPSPDFVFPPGRYALVLNGFGFDFTVAGPITAPEQCLEQVQVVDGIVVSECPKS